jgi:microcystin-dependent protein
MIEYADIIETPYTDAPICARLSITVVTLLQFLLSQNDTREAWGDWDEYRDEIEALIADASIEITTESEECEAETMWIAGDVKMHAGATYPLEGWLLCDGASLLRADYPALFTALGTQWGAADSTHFNIPDWRGRSPIGEGRLDGDGDNPLWQMGNKGGDAEITLTTAQIPTHAHNMWSGDLYVAGAAGAAGAMPSGAGAALDLNTGNAGGGEAHPNYHPVQAVRIFIYAG